MTDTITRAITISLYPFAGLERADLYAAMHRSFDLVQRAANEVMRQYFIADTAELVPGKKGKMTLPPLPTEVSKIAYDAARALCPELPSGAIADVCQRVRARYLADRWSVRVAGRQSVPTFRGPLPLSIRTQDWSLGVLERDGSEHFTATFGLLEHRGKDRPVVGLSIRTGRDADLLRKIIDETYERRTLEILPAGWKRGGPIRCKIVYRRDRPTAQETGGTLTIRTGSPSLLVADSGGRGFCWNARDLRGKIIAYEQRRQWRAEDRKHERRVPASRRRVQNADGGAQAEKHANRVKTELQHVAAQAVGYAKRQGYAGIAYDDSDRSWLPLFPWDRLATTLRQAAENAGLMFDVVVPDNEEVIACPTH